VTVSISGLNVNQQTTKRDLKQRQTYNNHRDTKWALNAFEGVTCLCSEAPNCNNEPNLINLYAITEANVFIWSSLSLECVGGAKKDEGI